ncbi:hypothetical protein COCC4DRAFT_186353 [Bipolaris maydis ATCC 48331]|uniref:Autophagy-related protein n=2 Tax=Cochliobolus heterostrophus TaxID=5016 RepID=M2US79_COCH5|nr:uncharacterized protein COCC4DRAFT_186353 [Bipolaris maydis ATCC 48331]EMD90738.1 hypothetical protein COCHEDRAFT_1140491 [Bipolaris maydis C5]KAJ5023476.1 autophagy-related protein 22-like protein [Bipolaris maydis]ENI09051.1 hypothetical protein COCC4DRAFT_186353 [Bipolaris maydis ATCC 48331]KAJ6206619.1 autophagy-related protein-like protein 22 [Bipolaris maydis]KAJ6269317.1 autophagy-related protein 22-like protein [Bipolaris maydis]
MSFSDNGDEMEEWADQSSTQKRYEGEDTSPTTPRELKGWYAYPIAAEYTGAFLPVLLEQLARENGVFFSDPSRPCVSRSTSSSRRASEGDKAAAPASSEQCMVTYLGMQMSTSSLALYTSSAAVLLQALVLVCLSSFADYGPYRKKMLMITSYTGSVASCLFIFISPALYQLAPILVIVGVACLGCSFVLLNAFLPLLVANYPDSNNTASRKPLSEDDDSAVELDSLNANYEAAASRREGAERLARDLERSAQISSKGVGYGYMAAVFVEIIAILIIFIFSKTSVSKTSPTLSIRVVLFMVGLWWAIFSIPTLLWLRERPGPPLPTQQQSSISALSSSKLRTFFFYTAFSLKSFWVTLKKACALRQTLIFLISWFLLSDAVATISGTAVLFAKTELHMSTIAIALLSITSIGSGIIGAFAWPHIQRHYALQPKTVLLCCVAGMEIIPLYGLLGYIPLFQRLGFIGLQQAWEIYPIAVLHGIVMGGISSYARSVFAPLIPEGSEAAFFALYAVTDKGSSAVGPTLVGRITDNAGTIRPAFIFLAVLVMLPAPLLWRLDVEKGREDARAMAEGDAKGRGRYERVRTE